MHDASTDAERRANCHTNHVKINKVFSWFEGNGNPGAGKRLLVLEDLANGKGETASMIKIKDHIHWHEKSDRRRWELIAGIVLILATQIATIILNHWTVP